MRYWPEISFRYTDSEVNQKDNGKVNLIPRRTDSGGEINYTRCARVLRKDLCLGVKAATNMSTMENFSPASRICNTREPSWAEDFIDLSEFCQPSTIPTKMEDLVDERVTPPISSTVREHGFDYALEVNDGLDCNIEDTLWCMSSPMAMQEELCDPISDWLKATKETSNTIITNNVTTNNIQNNNDNLSARTQQHQQVYNINDTLLSSTLTSVPKYSEYDDRKPPLTFIEDKVASPPLQPDTTFFHSSAESVFNDNRNPILAENLFSSGVNRTCHGSAKNENILRLPTAANSLFSGEKIPDTTFSFRPQNSTATATAAVVAATTVTSTPVFMERKPDISTISRVTIDTNVSSPCSVQSPSITQSNLNQEESVQLASTQSIAARRNVRFKLKMEESSGEGGACCMDTPQILQPLVNKNSEFDLVSYVFDDNKPSTSFDVSDGTSSVIGGGHSLSLTTIKTEPKEEPCVDTEVYHKPKASSSGYKRRLLEDEPDFFSSGKRKRKNSTRSNCSSTSGSSCSNIEDITQIESEKYRELRNRNNEASRRSRANRKSREVEMKDHAHQLEAENRRLKVKAEEMEQLVKRLRNCLMQIVLKRR